MCAYKVVNFKEEHPDISVAMLAYNHEKYISEAIESVLIQKTHYSYKIIIAEDCSTDKTRDIIIDYQKKYPEKIKLILQEKNVGASQNVLDLLSNTEGQYIALLEGDDYWTDPLKLQKQVDFLEENHDFVICGHSALVLKAGSLTDELKPVLTYQRDLSSEQLMSDSFIVTLTSLFRAEPLKDLPEEFKFVTNGDTFLFRFLGQYGGYKYMGDNITPAVYRVHEGGVWSMIDNKAQIYNAMVTSFFLARYFDRVGRKNLATANYRMMLVRGLMVFGLSFNGVKKFIVYKLKRLVRRYFC